jgi:hypothetical protein
MTATIVTALEKLTVFNLDPVIILEFRLKGLTRQDHGDLGKHLAMQLYHLNDWLDVHFIHEFDVHGDESNGLDETISKVKQCIQQVEADEWPARVVVILTTHSSEANGHLKASVNGTELAPSKVISDSWMAYTY